MSKNKLQRLTSRQRAIYDFLKDKILNRGYGPTVREIGNEFGIRSPNGVMCHLKALEKKGLITREPHMSRAIQLTDWPARKWGVRAAGQLSANGVTSRGAGDERIDFSDILSGDDRDGYRVSDNSLLDVQIAAGDCLVLRTDAPYPNGATVLAKIKGRGVRLWRYYREGDRIRLESDSAGTASVQAKAGDVLGAVAGVVRRC